jgi:hypothetical protein
MDRSTILPFLLLTILICLVISQVAGASDSPPVQVSTYGIIEAEAKEFRIGKQVLPLGGFDPTSKQIEFIASHFDIVNIQVDTNKDALSELKQLNPGITILIYIDAVGKAYIDPDKLYESDYVHDSDGNRITRKGYGFQVRNPGSQHWRELWADKALQLISEYGVDGIFADDVWKGLWEGNFVGDPSIPQSTKDNWYSDMKGFLSYVKEQLGHYLLIPNTTDDREFVDVCDGKWEEEFVHPRWASYGSWWSETKWKRKIDGVRTVCQKEKIELVSGGCSQLERDSSWTQSHQTEVEELLGFCFSSYLLGASGHKSTFNFGTFWNRDGSRSYYAVFDEAKQLGAPLDDYYKFGSVYARDFENGKVLVNPTTSSYTVSFDQNYKTLDDQVVSSMTLDSHTGSILFRT